MTTWEFVPALRLAGPAADTAAAHASAAAKAREIRGMLAAGRGNSIPASRPTPAAVTRLALDVAG